MVDEVVSRVVEFLTVSSEPPRSFLTASHSLIIVSSSLLTVSSQSPHSLLGLLTVGLAWVRCRDVHVITKVA